jgi:hypothetical protein
LIEFVLFCRVVAEVTMQRNIRVVLALLTAAPVILPAQQFAPPYEGPVTQAQSLNGTSFVQQILIVPVAGTPFTATVVINNEWAAADGSRSSQHSVIEIARDSAGRIRNERHAFVPESFRGTPPLLFVHTYDPATRISRIYSPATMTDRDQVAPPPRRSTDRKNGNEEDLGSTTLNGTQARGTRITRTIPARVSGTGKPVHMVDEFWFSEELQMNVLEQHTDGRGGLQTLAILSIKREEPDASLFEVPAGYKREQITPPVHAPAAP